jgi:hypothetical protein
LAHRLAGNGSLGPGSALLVHGLLANYQSLQPLANELMKPTDGSKPKYTNVYSFAYDWQLDGVSASTALGAVLDSVNQQFPSSKFPNGLTIIGHSRGCIIARYALEVLGKTAPVKDAILISGPNEGALEASGGTALYNVLTDWLNFETDGIALVTLNESDSWISELGLGSSFLTQLNAKSSQRGSVNYYLVAGSWRSLPSDLVVGDNSALGADLTWPSQTAGLIAQHTVYGANHSNIKSDPNFIDDILTFVNLNPGYPIVANTLMVTVDPLVNDAQPDGWHYTATLQNTTSSPLTISYLTLDNYDQQGNWIGIQWYDPNTPTGTFFPTNVTACNLTVNAHDSLSLVWQDWTDDNKDPIDAVPTSEQAGWTIVTTYGTVQGEPRSTSVTLERYYQSLLPLPAATRAGHPAHGGVGLIGSARGGHQ